MADLTPEVKSVIQRMIDAGEPEENIATVIKRYASAPAQAAPEKHSRTWTDTAVDALPAIGGTLGGIVGGIGGTVAGMGVGGVPGAIGGAAVGGAGGEGFKQAINAMRGQPLPSSASGQAVDMAKAAAVQGGAQAVGSGLGAVMQPVGEALMQSAVKPGLRMAYKAVRAGQTIPVVKTLLDEGVNVSAGGIAKLQGILDATQQEIRNAVKSVPFSVNPFAVTSRLGDVAKRAATQVNPTDDLRAVADAGNEFLQHYGTSMIPGAEAQALKEGTYRSIGNKAYGELKGSTIESQKALARGLKEEIESELSKAGVNVSAPNARAGRAMEAIDAVSKRVAVGGNANPAGLAGLAVSHPTTFLAMIIDKSPVVKSMLARGLYHSAGAVSGVSPAVIRTAIQTLATSDHQKEDQ